MQPTFNEQLRTWAREATTRERKPLSYSTLQKHLSYLKWVLPVIGNTRLDAINEDLLGDLFAYLKQQTTQRGGPLSAQTLEDILKSILLVKGSCIDGQGLRIYLKRDRRINRLNVGLE